MGIGVQATASAVSLNLLVARFMRKRQAVSQKIAPKSSAMKRLLRPLKEQRPARDYQGNATDVAVRR